MFNLIASLNSNDESRNDDLADLHFNSDETPQDDSNSTHEQIVEMRANALQRSFNDNARARIELEESRNKHSCVNQLITTLRLDHKTLETKIPHAHFVKLVESDAFANFDMICNSVKSDSNFNVYALKKVMRKIDSIVQDKLVAFDTTDQKYCIACIATIEKNRGDDEYVFDRSKALAMLSRAFDASAINLDVSTLARKFNVKANTAETQVSSSFRTLEAMNILRFDDSVKARCVVSDINREHAFYKLVKRFLEA